MFHRLKEKWQLSWPQFILVFSTFAIGGSFCGYAGKRLIALMGWEKDVLYYLVYILLITLIWPLCVITISIPLGQFPFFKNYLLKMWRRMVGKPSVAVHRHHHIAIFASGTGTNAARIIAHLKNHPSMHVSLVVCNKAGAGVLQLASRHQIPVLMLEKETFFRGHAYLPDLQQKGIDFIVLAGFLWKIPPTLIAAYPEKIINIHPALLPKFGGKGMYGEKVHAAVIAAGEQESGITIHYVNEQFDEGTHIFQAKCPVKPLDTPDTLAQRIHELEHRFYPEIVEKLVSRTEFEN